MDPKLNQEIICLVALYKAHIQQRMHLQNQISFLSIRSNFFRSNSDWRRSIEIIPRIKVLRQSFTKFKIHSKLFVSIFKKNPVPESNLNEILNHCQTINNTFNSMQENLIEFNKEAHEVNFLNYSYTEKQSKLEQISLVQQENCEKLESLKLKRCQLRKTRDEICELKEKLSLCKENLKELSVKRFQKSSCYVNDIKGAEVLSSLSSKHLDLRSKWLLKAEIAGIVEAARTGYEKYSHFLNKEKRKLQKLSNLMKSEQNDSKISELTGSRTLSHLTTYEFFQSFRSISPIKFSYSEESSRFGSLIVETVDEVFDSENSKVLYNSISEQNPDDQQKIDFVEEKFDYVFS